MKNTHIGICAAFYAGYSIVSFVLDYPHEVQFVATCDCDNSEYEEKIASLCIKKCIPLYRKININSELFINKVSQHNTDIAVMAWWPTIIKKKAIDSTRIGWLNMHPSLLPYGRGKHGYYWSIVEKKPFGVTLHFVDQGIDTGAIIFQKQIDIEITDTGETLYNKGLYEAIKLFKDSYAKIIALDFCSTPQNNSDATTHHSREIELHSCIDLDKEYKAINLIDIMRGRTFTNGNSAFFFSNGEKYLVKISIKKEE